MLIFLRWYVFHRTGFTTPGLLRGLTYALFIVAALSLFLLRIGYPITGFLVSTGVVAGVLGIFKTKLGSWAEVGWALAHLQSC